MWYWNVSRKFNQKRNFFKAHYAIADSKESSFKIALLIQIF